MTHCKLEINTELFSQQHQTQPRPVGNHQHTRQQNKEEGNRRFIECHLGILFLANMQLGYFTPPVGMNLFIASFRFNKPVMTLYKATIPFFIILLACVLVITYWPGLSLMLLN